jgi:hypothetical protein
VIELDTKQPDEADVNLSHWWTVEDRATGDLWVAGARSNRDYTRDTPVLYVVGCR